MPTSSRGGRRRRRKGASGTQPEAAELAEGSASPGGRGWNLRAFRRHCPGLPELRLTSGAACWEAPGSELIVDKSQLKGDKRG